MVRLVTSIVVVTLAALTSRAQQPEHLEFDVVSIKRNTSEGGGSSARTLPDGTTISINRTIQSMVMAASPEPVRDVVGLPDWAMSERYDITTKPPAGSTREQRALMWQSLYADRMKLRAHVETREQETYALVLARSDGRLGPQLKPSALDCSPRPPGSPPPTPPTFSADDAKSRCGGLFGQGTIVSGGISLDSLVLSLAGLAGRHINNRTGLTGSYALTLDYSVPRRPGASPDAPDPSDAPDIFTALQEQLGLKLQPEKSMVKVFAIDHIERPTEN